MDRLTHIAADGTAQMVDVSAKPLSHRVAIAAGKIRLRPETLELISQDRIAKGNVYAVARIAGIQAAKQTSQLIPLCHNLDLSHVEVAFDPVGAFGSLPAEEDVALVIATASDAATAVVTNAYKLYPWAWLVADAEQNGSVASLSSVRWLEPAWTVMLTSKGILPILWEMFPGHRNLLETYTSPRSSLVRYVQKPVQSREGANVRVVTMGATEAESADNNYGAEGYVYQAYGPVFHDSAVTAVVGSWVVQGKWAALGVREDKGLITGADSVNVPIYVA